MATPGSLLPTGMRDTETNQSGPQTPTRIGDLPLPSQSFPTFPDAAARGEAKKENRRTLQTIRDTIFGEGDESENFDVTSRKERREQRRPLLIIALGPWLGALTAFLLAWAQPEGVQPEAMRCAGVAVWMAFWWMTECLPLGVTSLLPLAVFPPLGLMDNATVARQYSTTYMWLFFGGFQLSFAIVATGLQKRVAILIMRKAGTNVANLMLGTMGAIALLSMFLTNTSSTVMLLPIVQALAAAIDAGRQAGQRSVDVPFLLGLAYSASAGGMGTIIGTVPNGVFIKEASAQASLDITFLRFMGFGVPISLMLVLVIWAYLVWKFEVPRAELPPDHPVFDELNRDLGPMTEAERYVGYVFCVAVFGWTTSKLWQSWLPGYDEKDNIEGDIAVGVVLALFCLRAQFDYVGEKQALMTWDRLLQTPWHILFLFGGGFALGKAFEATKLSNFIGDILASIPLPPPLMMLLTVLTVTFLTEFTSNTATANVVLPILAKTAISIGKSPLYLMAPATLACSCAFMMPVATPPNAIVFSTGKIDLKEMISTGIGLNIITGIVVTVYCLGYGVWALGG